VTLKRVLAATAVPLVAVATAAPAHADQYDYVSTLDSNGIYYPSISKVIDLGKQVCSVGRRAPAAGASMMNPLIDLLYGAGYKSSEEGWIIANAAVANMCPDVLPKLRASLAQTPP
jgi:hypothetical protein